MNIKVRQEEIIEEFGLLDGDLEMSINCLIELGDQLAPFPKNNKNDDFIVKGCQSKVWLFAQEEDQQVEQKDEQSSMPHPNHYKKWFEYLDKIDLRRHLSDVEYILIEGALKKNSGSVTAASKSLKINRTTLIEKMKKYSIPKVGND